MNSCADCHLPVRVGAACPACGATSTARSTAAALLLGLAIACVGDKDPSPTTPSTTDGSYTTAEPAYGISTGTTWTTTTQDDGYTTDATDADVDTDTDADTGAGTGGTGGTPSPAGSGAGGSGDAAHSGGN